jgi:lysophospholipase L1-like esterase
VFYPIGAEAWPAGDRAWLQSNYEASGLLSVEAAMNNLAATVAKIRERSEVPILIYNLSPIIPGDQIHCYAGLGETRIHKFNLALEELSENSGISIIDVDTIVARHGADALKLDAVHLKPQGYSLVAREVVRVLDDLGVLDTAIQ